MGADGGVEWIALKDHKKYDRLMYLLSPFWQIGHRGGRSGCSSNHESAHLDWQNDNSTISEPYFLIGYYGTDRGDMCSLETLRDMLSPDYEICCLTFKELDQYYRIQNDLDSWNWTYYHDPWYKCWKQHWGYHWQTHQEYVANFKELVDMTISDWIEEVSSILELNSYGCEETWT